MENELRGLSAAARIPFLKEDVERVQGYNRKLKGELHALLKQVSE